jgi:hypothetical protein
MSSRCATITPCSMPHYQSQAPPGMQHTHHQHHASLTRPMMTSSSQSHQASPVRPMIPRSSHGLGSHQPPIIGSSSVTSSHQPSALAQLMMPPSSFKASPVRPMMPPSIHSLGSPATSHRQIIKVPKHQKRSASSMQSTPSPPRQCSLYDKSPCITVGLIIIQCPVPRGTHNVPLAHELPSP